MPTRVSAAVDQRSIDQKLVDLAQDAVYITVGCGVLTVQRLQVRRRELLEQLDRRMGDGRNQLRDLATSLDERVDSLDSRFDELESRLDEVVAKVRDRLPDPAGQLVGQAHDAARSARSQVRDLVRRSA